MKDDHMGNGQLKPAYNVQIGTEHQYIVNYSIHQQANDMPVLKPHLESTKAQLSAIGQPMPQRVSTDAGYGSEENYDYIEQEGLENYMKYPGFYQEQKKKTQQDPFRWENLYYNPAGDYFVCPMGQHLTFFNTAEVKNKSGHVATLRYYQAQRCDGCPLRGQCHQAKTDRIIQINPNLQRHKAQARKNLNSVRGIFLRKRRSIEPESVFGQLKWNRKFNRFMLKGIKKVSCEFGVLAIAHNIKKMWTAKCRARIVPLRPNANANVQVLKARSPFFSVKTLLKPVFALSACLYEILLLCRIFYLRLGLKQEGVSESMF